MKKKTQLCNEDGWSIFAAIETVCFSPSLIDKERLLHNDEEILVLYHLSLPDFFVFCISLFFAYGCHCIEEIELIQLG